MAIRLYSLIIGLIFLLIGIAGFFPQLLQPVGIGEPEVSIRTHHGYLLGLFPVNTLHNIVHLAVGIAGIASYASVFVARAFCRVLAIVYAILAIMGLLPGLNTAFGLVPLYGNDIWLHGAVALTSAYFGWLAPTVVAETDLATD